MGAMRTKLDSGQLGLLQ